MKGVVTVDGRDKVGIIYRVTKILAENNVNVEDISQTIRQGHFTMTMIVDLGKISCNFKELKDQLERLGEELDLFIRIQREEIFNEMHTI